MEEIERQSLLAYSQLPVFKRRMEMAKQIIREALAIAPTCIAVSWGKDSTVLLHLAQQVQSDIPVVHWRTPHQELLHDYQRVIQAYCDRFHPNYSEINLDLETTIPAGVARSRIWEQYPMSLVGIRAEENPSRRGAAVRKYGAIHQYQSGAKKGSWRAWPLARWSWMDVWAYVFLHELPYLSSYDHLASGERDRSRSSNVMPYLGGGSSSQRLGRIAQIKAYAPEAYAFLSEFYPEIASSS